MRKTLIFGNGFIGNKLQFGMSNTFLTTLWVDNVRNVRTEIDLFKPEIVINCIGRTGIPNIDWCEDNKEETLFANLTVPLIIAEACSKMSIDMIHMSTGCIFDGGPFTEEDEPNFIESYYAKTKYLAEQALQDFNILQIRARMPIDNVDSPRNFITKIFSYKKLIDEFNSVIVLDDLVQAVTHLIDIEATGIYNVVNPEPVSHSQIIKIFEPYLGKYTGEFIKLKHLKTKAPRSNCILSVDKLIKTGFKIRPTRKALEDCAKRYQCLNLVS